MSEFINYSQYQELMNGSSPLSISPRMSTGGKRKNMICEVEELRDQLILEQKENEQLRIVNEALLDAIRRVFSPKLV